MDWCPFSITVDCLPVLALLPHSQETLSNESKIIITCLQVFGLIFFHKACLQLSKLVESKSTCLPPPLAGWHYLFATSSCLTMWIICCFLLFDDANHLQLPLIWWCDSFDMTLLLLPLIHYFLTFDVTPLPLPFIECILLFDMTHFAASKHLMMTLFTTSSHSKM